MNLYGSELNIFLAKKKLWVNLVVNFFLRVPSYAGLKIFFFGKATQPHFCRCLTSTLFHSSGSAVGSVYFVL